MDLNSDFAQRVVQGAHEAAWTASPLPGVERRMLDRIGAEVARATSIVRYAANSHFDRHVHGGGEEILVMEGVFSDERGDYPAGSYLRNPPGSSHAPFSRAGCTLFVKLWQFAPDDMQPVRIDTASAAWHAGLVAGLTVMPLHEHDGVSTALVRWAPHTRFSAHTHPGGEEILVLEGVFRDEDGDYPAGTWLRSPRGSRHTPYTGAEGALIYVKVGAIGANFMRLPAQTAAPKSASQAP
ncbi:MAG: cupin domain-containing protein [Burkholderiales bacterium]|nr:cupin domain-containing protein [Burkholderiales bacterium]